MLLGLTAEIARDITADLIGIIAFDDDVRDPATPWLGPDATALADLVRQDIAAQGFKAKAGQTLIMETQGRIQARRVALVGAGARTGFGAAGFRNPAAVLTRIANSVGARSMVVLDRERFPAAEALMRVEAVAQGLLLGAYRFDKYLSAEKRTPMSLQTAFLQFTQAEAHAGATAAIDRATHVARAACYARDLVNEPGGTLTPRALAQEIAGRATAAGLEVTLLGPTECRARGMGMFLAVAQGSSEEPRFIHVAWRPPQSHARVVLVGKGVTFDSGGLSLKTTEGMLDMKSDMAGAAAVMAAILVAAEERLPIEIHALAACTENMPSGTAYKLGDVLRSMSGRTVEINNTDAEGRLTLADALTYGLGLNPDVILDFATLTGACVVALGPHIAGVMSNHDAARDSWLKAARQAGEDMWPLPLPERLTEQLKSEIADLRNTGERWGGALTAGLFLQEFVDKKPWIHVDLAGPATSTKEWGCFGKGATGFGVASIVEYLRHLAQVAPPAA